MKVWVIMQEFEIEDPSVWGVTTSEKDAKIIVNKHGDLYIDGPHELEGVVEEIGG